jgi:hypothetical protein
MVGTDSIAATRLPKQTHAPTEELPEALLSVRSVPRLYNEDQLSLGPAVIRREF